MGRDRGKGDERERKRRDCPTLSQIPGSAPVMCGFNASDFSRVSLFTTGYA